MRPPVSSLRFGPKLCGAFRSAAPARAAAVILLFFTGGARAAIIHRGGSVALAGTPDSHALAAHRASQPRISNSSNTLTFSCTITPRSGVHPRSSPGFTGGAGDILPGRDAVGCDLVCFSQ